MKKLFYRLTSSRSLTRLFLMHAGLEKRRRVIGQSSVFAVVALAAFVSLGAVLIPQVGQAQECIWDCDLGSDFFDNPGENSPGFSIVYCFDQPCVAGLGIFTGAIPTASVKQEADPDTCDGITPVTITISGNVVAVLRDKNGNLDPKSAAEAFFNLVVKKVKCSVISGNSILTRVVSVTELPGDVFAGNITIRAAPILNSGNTNLSTPSGWPGCTNDKKTGVLLANCSFPLGIDVSKTDKELSAKFPAGGVFALKEVYRGNGLGRLVALRMCKGDANSQPSSIACTVGGDVAVGGFLADAVFNFEGNWSGAGSHTFNPGSGSNPFDIVTPLFASIDIKTITASANGGTPVSPTGCNPMPSQGVLRCFFIARALAPNGCSGPVDLVVRGNVFSAEANRFVKFVSEDDPVCSK